MKRFLLAGLLAAGLIAGPAVADDTPSSILNVSYDISRELYADVNAAFQKKVAADSGKTIEVKQSHGGSSRQARAILEGLEADVVTFNQVTDVDVLAKNELVAKDWKAKFPNNASPYYSFPSFLVRAGNPKGIKDWGDLARDDVAVIFPNPKTSGNARYTYLGAKAWAEKEYKGDAAKVTEYLTKLFGNVPVFDTGGRAATTTFVERETGDVLITFEAETTAIRKQYGADKFEAVTPSISVLGEFPVAVVDKVVDKRGSRQIATDYLTFLYSPEGQEILAQHGNRVHDAAVIEKHKAEFPPVELVTVEETFGGWDIVGKTEFQSGGPLDTLLAGR